MSLTEIKKILALDTIRPNVFLLFGDEVFLKNHYKNQLIEKVKDDLYPEMNNFYFDEKNYKVTEVKEAIETLPFFAS